jgi:hypothetical protein
MSYTPPSANAINFDLQAYTAPAGNAINFELAGTSGNTGTVAEAQPKSTEAAGGQLSYSASIVEIQKPQTEAVTGALSYTATVNEAQPKQTETIAGSIPATPITGDVAETQPQQEEAIRCFQASQTRPVASGYWTGPIQKIEIPEPAAIGVVVNEQTRPQKDIVRGRLTISAMVNETVTVQSRMTGTIGRSRALRELDIAAILNAVA